MKIQSESQQPTMARQVDKTAEKPEAGAVRKKETAKKPHKGDTVELSSTIDAELKARAAEKAQRVETLKSLVKAGKYKVDARDVAKKMISGGSGE